MLSSIPVYSDSRSIAIALSAHAALRVQQRGLRSVVLDCLLRYGHYAHDHLGCEVITIDAAALRQIAKSEPAEVLRLVGEARSVYAVLAHGRIVTVGYRHRKVLRDRGLSDTRKGRGRKPHRCPAQETRRSSSIQASPVH